MASGIEKLAHGAFDESGEIRPFVEQLDDYAYGRMRTGDMFLVSPSSYEAGVTECADLPIVMKQSIVKKVNAFHDLQLEDLKNLPEWLATHPLAMESLHEMNSLVLVADALDHEGRDILVALHLEKGYQQVTVNDIASVYGKDNLAYLIENTIAADKEIFVNSRTGDWILRTGVPFPEQIANHLQDLLYQKSQEASAGDRIRRTGVPFPERIADRPQDRVYQNAAKAAPAGGQAAKAAPGPSAKAPATPDTDARAAAQAAKAQSAAAHPAHARKEAR